MPLWQWVPHNGDSAYGMLGARDSRLRLIHRGSLLDSLQDFPIDESVAKAMNVIINAWRNIISTENTFIKGIPGQGSNRRKRSRVPPRAIVQAPGNADNWMR